jgi:hypothetical protein
MDIPYSELLIFAYFGTGMFSYPQDSNKVASKKDDLSALGHYSM